MTLEINKSYHGFRLLTVKKIKEVASTTYQFEHEKSGARLLFLENKDDNKVFSITFRTPPTDDTGVAHIVEHSTLCGSRKFPMKEPFVELVKGSLNTYLNAMTFPDKTMYPVASRNDKDFQNLMDVYLDAVFYPAMYTQPEILMQEGWHYEIEKPEDELTYSGVVYNEMKGALSSAESLLDKEILISLFPDTTYGFESGGDPESIPELTQEMFIDFHSKYYHPTNSYIYLYGDMDILEKLAFLDQNYLNSFDRIAVPSKIDEQKLFTKPQKITKEYPIASTEQTQDKTFLSLNAIVGKATDAEEMLALEILEHALLKTQAAPLKKALIDAKLGKDVLSSFEDSLLQPVFSIIVSGSDEKNADEFQKVIQTSLQKIVKEGIDRELLEASINLLEFKLREADFGQFPTGLIYDIKLMNSWLYDEDPTMFLYYEAALQKMKDGLASHYFENIIQTHLLANPHKTIVVLKPNQRLAEEKEVELTKLLAQAKGKMSDAELATIISLTAKLKERQETPDTPEALATIPLLELKDIKKETEALIQEKRVENGTDILFHAVTTNQIAYLNLYFDASAIPEDLLPYAFLLSELLGKVSTQKYNYSSLANKMNLHTGGISYDISAYTQNAKPDSLLPKFKVQAKSLVTKLPKLCELLTEVITNSSFDDEKRVRELIDQCKATMEMYMIKAAQQLVAGRLASYFSPAAAYNEKGMLSFYDFIVDFDKNFVDRYSQMKAKFAQLQPMIFNKQNLLVSVTLEEENYSAFTQAFKQVQAVLSTANYPQQTYSFAIDKKNEGFMTSSKVQYVSKGANFIKLGYAFTGSMRVMETILRYDYFWNRIRVQGGAYGAFTQFRRNGNMMFGSYRDPNLAETITVFDETVDYLQSFAISEREMLKYIIGTMSTLDTPLTPKMKGELAAECYIHGVTELDLQRERDEILATGQKDIAALGALVTACMQENNLCVLGSETKIKENGTVFGQLKTIFD